MGKFCWNSTENVSLAKVPLLSMGGKLLQASKLHIWCINSLLNKCRPYITISGSLQPFKMVKIVPEKKCPRVPVWVKGGGCDRYLGNARIDPATFYVGLPWLSSHLGRLVTLIRDSAEACLRESFVILPFAFTQVQSTRRSSWLPNITHCCKRTLQPIKRHHINHTRDCRWGETIYWPK